MINQYETVFILSPILSIAQAKEAAEKFKKVLLDEGAEIEHEENWGLRKLAYPIKHKATGYYFLIEFKAKGEIVEKLETKYKYDEKVIRFLTFRMDKHSIAYSIKKRNMNKQKVEASKVEVNKVNKVDKKKEK